MRDDWEIKTLEHALEKGSSNLSINKLKDDEGDYPFYSAKGFVKNISFYHQEKDYLAIIKDGAGVGRVSFHPAKSSVVGTLQYLLPKEGFDLRFLYYYLLSVDFSKYFTGSTIPHIYFKDYKSEPFPVLPIEEQKEIVEILDQAFESIEKAKANIEKNIENAKELFQSKLNQIFSQTGDGWEDIELEEISRIQYGYTSKIVSDGNVKYVRITDIQDRKVDWSSVPLVNISNDEKSKFILEKGDIVFARTGATTGKSYLMVNPVNSVFASYLIRVKCDMAIISPEFLNLFFQSGIYWDHVRSGISGSAQGGFNASKLGKMKIHYPKEKKEQLKFVQSTDIVDNHIQSILLTYQEELKNLEELKKAILQKAFSGELTNKNKAA